MASSIYNIKERPIAKLSTSSNTRANEKIPIVIDNGTWQCRAGYASNNTPNMIFDNILHKLTLKDSEASINFLGNENIPPCSKDIPRSCFDQNVVYNFEVMESILDGIFTQLNVQSDTVDHPLLMTEAVCNPFHFRKEMNELLFECYQIPRVSYGIDAVFSCFYNSKQTVPADTFIVSAGHTASYVIPFIDGRICFDSTKRISFGGQQAADYLLKLMQTKYSNFPCKMTLGQAQSLLFDHCYVAEDYLPELDSYLDASEFSKKDRVIQFPYPDDASIAINKSNEEALQNRRKEQALRLRERAEANKNQKILMKEEDLQLLLAVKARKEEIDSSENFLEILHEMGIQDENQLEISIQKTQDALSSLKGITPASNESVKDKYDFRILEISDSELSESEIKEKKKLRLIKASMEAKERLKKEKEELESQRKLQEQQDEQRRSEDLEGWIKEKHSKRQEVMQRIKNRQKLKKDLQNRKSHASYMKMKTLSLLTNEAFGMEEGSQQSKRRKKKDQKELAADDQGIELLQDLGDSDAEERDECELQNLEAELSRYDPAFEFAIKEKYSIFEVLTKGLQKDRGPTTAELYQLHMNVERIRVPEVLFQPHIIGIDQAGISEILCNSIHKHKNSPANFFLTGGMANLRGFEQRLLKELRQECPIGTELKIQTAADPVLDAWKGAAQFALESNENASWISKAEYEEFGAEYFKESWHTNPKN